MVEKSKEEAMAQRGPIGIELVKKGILKQSDIDKALEYQRRNPDKRIIEDRKSVV